MRAATRDDLPAIVRLTRALHATADMRLPIDDGCVASFATSLILRPDGLALVTGDPVDGMLCASMERSPLGHARIAVEHGWHCTGGGGVALLRRYIAWAREMGAWGARLSTPGGTGPRALGRLGFRAAETAWVIEF